MNTLHEAAQKAPETLQGLVQDLGKLESEVPAIESLRSALAQQYANNKTALRTLEDLTAWLDGLGGSIHTYSLRGIALAAWDARGKALEQQGVETDTTRLEFMQFYGAQVCWGNDSEVCYVRWYTHWGEQELRRTSNHNDWRVAIDEAIEMEKKP